MTDFSLPNYNEETLLNCNEETLFQDFTAAITNKGPAGSSPGPAELSTISCPWIPT